VISLTEMPAPGKPDAAPSTLSRDGYHVLSWTEGGVTYWAVSDVAPGELSHFVDLFRAAPAEQ
jgi:anti-sigma factor RsiW